MKNLDYTNMGYSVSKIYDVGQKFASSIDQGSMYMEVSYTNPLKFDPTLTIMEPRSEAIVEPTVSNYVSSLRPYFMGSFDGFWIHKVYNNGNLVMTVQTVDQDMFIPVQHDRVESVSMELPTESIPYDGPVRPPVPAPGVTAMLGLAAIIAIGRRRFG
jgi:hypothetical protein